MKRRLRILLSRFTLVALTIIALFLAGFLAVAGAFYLLKLILEAVFVNGAEWIDLIFRAVMWIVVVATAIHIINRNMMPEAKVLWLLCIVAFNAFGVAIYAVFSYNRPSRRQRKKFLVLKEEAHKFTRPMLSEGDLKAEMGRWAGVSRALSVKNEHAVVYRHTQTKYFPTGEDFFRHFLFDLQRAKKYIFLEYFIIEYGVMWGSVLDILRAKAAAGVEVRVLYDDIGSMGYVRAGYYKYLRKQGIKCHKFNPFVPVVSNFHNNRDHRKIAVIDGEVAYTGGINLADEYINVKQPYGNWKDTAVRLEGEGAKSLLFMFLRFWDLCSGETEDFSRFLPEESALPAGEGLVQPYSDGPVPLYGRHLGEDLYINILSVAEKYVWIMTPYLILDYRMREALVSAAARGVDVRIVVPHIPDKKTAFALTRSNYMALIKGGVKIYEYTPGFVHAKSFLADDEVSVVGTINLDYRSLMHHYENAVLMYRTAANAELKADYEATFKKCALQTEEDAKKSVVWRGMCEILKAFAPLF